MTKLLILILGMQLACQDGRAVQGAAFRSQSGSPGVGSNPTSDNSFFFPVRFMLLLSKTLYDKMLCMVLYMCGYIKACTENC